MNCPECDRLFVDDQRSCVCGWGRQKAQARIEDLVRSTYRPIPFGITREQFGVQLFDAIRHVGAIKQLQHYLPILVEDPKGLQAMREREQQQRRELAAILPTLTDAEDAALRQRYPEVTTW